MKEKCCWDPRDDIQIRDNFNIKCAQQFSDTMKRVIITWENKRLRPRWISPDVFEQLIAHCNSDSFKSTSEKAKKNRASEVGGCNYAYGSISIADVARRMVNLIILQLTQQF